MSTVIISTQPPSEEVTQEVITLEIFVKEIPEGYFDRLEVWRSRDGSTGPFEELTAAVGQAAFLPETGGAKPSAPLVGGEVAVVGDTLELTVKDVELTITFTGVDPLTLGEVATQIITQGVGLLDSWVDEAGQLVVSTLEVGTAAELVITGGTAYPTLGLPLDTPATGRAGRIGINPGTVLYTFPDFRGSKDYWYRTRFRNSSNNATSEFSAAFPADQVQGIGRANVACGFVDLVTADGKPQQGQLVQLYTEYNGTIIDGKTMVGGPLVKSTDKNGHVEFVLVRGQTMNVSLPGTSLNRRIVVPTDPSVLSFNLLDPAVGTGDDVFKVAVPNIITAERRTL